MDSEFSARRLLQRNSEGYEKTMKRLAVSLVTCVLALTAAPRDVHAQTQAEMNEAAGKELTKADAQLNKLYKKVLDQRTDDPEFSEALKESQRAWLKFVDAQMKVLFHVKEGESPRQVYGSSYAAEYAASKTALIEARIEQLKELVLE